MTNQKRTNKITRSHNGSATDNYDRYAFRAPGRKLDWSRKGSRKFRDYNDTPAWARGL